MQSPSEIQKEILFLSSGMHLVLAPPGSGKTELLASRVPLAIENGVLPEQMLCVTFTNRAARNMKIRIGDMPGKPPFIGTLHRFGMRFLALNKLISLNTALLDEEDAEQFLKDAQDSVLEDGRNGFSRKLNDIAQYINQRSIKHLKLDVINNNYSHDSHLEAVAERYDQIKKETFSVDFNDVLNLTLHHLMYTQVSRMCNFKWLQIDEVQDLSELQWNIITRVTADDAHIIYFGDFDQAIFSFMGASHDVLKQFTADAQVHHLAENYRSPAKLINVFNAYAVANLPSRTEILRVPATHQNLEAGKVEVVPVTGTFENESQTIAKEVVSALLGDHSTIAVLTRSNSDADIISRNLSETSIEHFRVSGFDLFRRKEIKDVLAFMRSKHKPQDRMAWARVFHIFGGIDSLKASRELVTEMFKLGLNPTDFIKSLNLDPSITQFSEQFLNERWVIFDTETTGLDVANDDIVQIAAIEIKDGKPTGVEFEVYIQTEKSLEESQEIHGICKDVLSSKGIPPKDGLRDFIKFAGDAIICGHNVNFDLSILHSNLIRAGIEWAPSNSYDTLQLTRKLHPGMFSYKLGDLLKALDIEGENTHNALDDVRATAGLAVKLNEKAQTEKTDRDDFVKQYRKYLDKFSSSISSLWNSAEELLNQNENLSSMIRHFFEYVETHKKYDINHDAKSNIAKLADFLDTHHTVIPMKKLMSKMLPELLTYSEADLISENDKVIVSTIHKAKGLQFDGVIVTSCIDDVYPHFHSKKVGKSAVEEDARLLYVAMTRSKRSIIFTHHDTAINRGGTFSRVASPFLSFLP